MKQTTDINDLEKLITVRLIQEDVESVSSLMTTERDAIFAMAIMPYYALFIQSCQEYMGETFIEGEVAKQIKDIRNYIKAFGEGFGKSKRRVNSVDANQDEQFRLQLRFDFMKNWNIHFNLGTYWTEDKHVIGNTQMYADFLGIDNMFNTENGKKMREIGYQMGSFVSSVREGLSKSMTIPEIGREKRNVFIDYFYDLNTNMNDVLFKDDTKTLNLFYLNLVSSMNFVKYILRPMFSVSNTWLFRIEYIVTYYTYRALQRLKNYCENNIDIEIDIEELSNLLNIEKGLFQSKFRNCMMHYNIETQGVLSLEYIEKPFYGIIETCFEGMDFQTFQSRLDGLSEAIIEYLEGHFNKEKIELQRL